MTTHTLISLEPLGKNKTAVVIKVKPGWIARLFGAKEKELVFHGSGTVWRLYPKGEHLGLDWDKKIIRLIEEND